MQIDMLATLLAILFSVLPHSVDVLAGDYPRSVCTELALGRSSPAHAITSRAQRVTAASTAQENESQPRSIAYVGLGTARTLVLVLGVDCQSCRESFPFYKRLAQQPGMDGKEKRFIVFTVDGAIPAKRLLDAEQIKPHRILSYPTMSRIEVPNDAPGIYVFNAEGKRLGAWTGRLSSQQESEVLEALTERPTSRK